MINRNYLNHKSSMFTKRTISPTRGLQGLKVLKCMKLNYKRTSRGKIEITVQYTRGLQVQQGSTS
jgi:hypothetical protein